MLTHIAIILRLQHYVPTNTRSLVFLPAAAAAAAATAAAAAAVAASAAAAAAAITANNHDSIYSNSGNNSDNSNKSDSNTKSHPITFLSPVLLCTISPPLPFFRPLLPSSPSFGPPPPRL